MQAPKRTLAFPQKQETRICRALVFLLISCYTAPSLDYFLYFFLVPPRLDTPDQRFICSHETNGFFLQPGISKHKLLVRSIHESDVFWASSKHISFETPTLFYSTHTSDWHGPELSKCTVISWIYRNTNILLPKFLSWLYVSIICSKKRWRLTCQGKRWNQHRLHFGVFEGPNSVDFVRPIPAIKAFKTPSYIFSET